MAKEGLFLQVVEGSLFTNFVYPLAFSLLPFDAFLIETYIPIFISLAIPIIAYVLIETTSEYKGWIAVFAMIAWLAVYRLSSDLHSNLLGIAICLIGSSAILGSATITKKRIILAALAFFIASFVHFETTIFFFLILFMTLITTRKIMKDYRYRLFLLVISVLPAFLLYVNTQFNRLQAEGQIATGSGIVNGDIFENGFGIYLLPLVIAGLLFLIFKKKKSSFDVFLLYWTAFSFLLIGLHFFLPVSNYAYRALVMFPSPFLLVPLVDFIAVNAFSTRIDRGIFRFLLASFIITTIVSASLMASFSLQYFARVFVPRDVYEELVYLKDYGSKNNTNEMLFIYNLDNPGIVELYDYWVSAVIGNHLSYYGNLFDLLQLKEGQYNLISRRYFNVLKGMQPQDIFNRTLVILTQFYSSKNVLSYIDAKELRTNIYVSNLTKLVTKPDITIPINAFNLTSVGHWYLNTELGALEIYSNETQDPYVLLNLSMPQGNYNISLTYWDGSKGNGLEIVVNDEPKAVLNYTASSRFQLSVLENLFLSNATTIIKISVFKQHPYQYFARLQSVTIMPNPFKIQSVSQR
jgi:hypothetical protein